MCIYTLFWMFGFERLCLNAVDIKNIYLHNDNYQSIHLHFTFFQNLLSVLQLSTWKNLLLFSNHSYLWYAFSTTWLFPCCNAAVPNFSQHSGVSISVALSMAILMLPHSNAKSNLVVWSSTKYNATCGAPFFCKYAKIAWPHNLFQK